MLLPYTSLPSLVIKSLGVLVWSKSLITLRKMIHSTKNRSDIIIKSGWMDFPGSPAGRISPSNAGGVSSILGWRANNPDTSQPTNQNMKQKQYCNKPSIKTWKMVYIQKKKKKKNPKKSWVDSRSNFVYDSDICVGVFIFLLSHMKTAKIFLPIKVYQDHWPYWCSENTFSFNLFNCPH